MAADDERVLNINVGLLGHVDSGKTSLAKALSTESSTASFDRNPQSQERGITLDLGFSCFRHSPVPDAVAAAGYDVLQVTLVDCPGHASLIKTIIGGAQIIDIMVLVVDIGKGFQTQTAEGLVIGEITSDKLLVALNKVDTIDESKRDAKIAKVTKRILRTLQGTKFGDAQVVPVAAASGDNVDGLIEAIVDHVRVPVRDVAPERFLFSIDHCFSVKGQGTVITGTVQRGSVAPNDVIEFPDLGVQSKVKSIQMFRQPVQYAEQGDRIGMSVQIKAKSLERGLAAHPGTIHSISGCIIKVQRVKYFSGSILSGAKFHLSIGHSTVMATPQFFSAASPSQGVTATTTTTTTATDEADGAEGVEKEEADEAFSFDVEYLQESEMVEEEGKTVYAFLALESPVTCLTDAKLIASRLDKDIYDKSCRLAFHGTILAPLSWDQRHLLRLFRPKERTGQFVRIKNEHTVICKGLFPRGTDPSVFTGLTVISSHNGAEGTIQGTFGASNKIEVYFPEGGQTEKRSQIILRFKKYLYRDPSDTNSPAIIQ